MHLREWSQEPEELLTRFQWIDPGLKLKRIKELKGV